MLGSFFSVERLKRYVRDVHADALFFPPISNFDLLEGFQFEPPDARLEKALFDYVYELGEKVPSLFDWIHPYQVEDRFQTTPTLKGLEVLMEASPCYQVHALDLPKFSASLRRLGRKHVGFMQVLIHYETGHCNLAFLRFLGHHLDVCHLESGPLVESCRCVPDNCEALSAWGGTITHFVFRTARLKGTYGCRALMVMDHALFESAQLWNQIDWMKKRRPWWFTDLTELRDQGELLYSSTQVIRFMPPHLMMSMESVRELEAYIQEAEVRAFWGEALIDQMTHHVAPFMKACSFDLKEKSVNILLKIQHLLQIERLVQGLIPNAPPVPWRC
jgi:hypothetical protein